MNHSDHPYNIRTMKIICHHSWHGQFGSLLSEVWFQTIDAPKDVLSRNIHLYMILPIMHCKRLCMTARVQNSQNNSYIYRVHCNNVILRAMAYQISNLSIVYSSVYLRRRSKKIPKPRVIGLCEGNLLVTGEFPTKRPVTWRCFYLMTPSYRVGYCVL